MKNQMNKQKGFTLIELIIVIVILGILAVTAAPRFIDLQSDAREKTLEGVKAALQGASQLVYAKSAIAGTQSAATSSVTVNGAAVATVFGYPDAAGVTDAATVSTFLDLSSGDFAVLNGSTETPAVTGQFTISFTGETAANGCYVRYTSAASATTAPTIAVVNTSGTSC